VLIKKLGKDVARAAEAVGILAPNTTDASSAAEQRRMALVQATAAVANAEAELDAAYDAGKSPKELMELEAKVSDAKLTAQRAQQAYNSAERRLASAQSIEASKRTAEMVARRDAALDARAAAAHRIDALAAEMAAEVQRYNAQADVLAEAARAGVAARHTFGDEGATLVRNALEKADALPSGWGSNSAEQPNAVEIAAKFRGAALAVA
jgi:hypothetical protein